MTPEIWIWFRSSGPMAATVAPVQRTCTKVCQWARSTCARARLSLAMRVTRAWTQFTTDSLVHLKCQICQAGMIINDIIPEINSILFQGILPITHRTLAVTILFSATVHLQILTVQKHWTSCWIYTINILLRWFYHNKYSTEMISTLAISTSMHTDIRV